MLPTLGFVASAYLLYALFRVYHRHHHRQYQPYRRYRWKGRLGWVGGAGIGLGIIILVAIVGLPSPYENLRTASMVTASWGQDPLMPHQAMQRQEILPVKNQSQQGQPVYAYLHPETPTPQLLSEKKGPGLRCLPKPTLKKPTPRTKAAKPIAKGPKKDKAPAKTKIKKKPNAPAGTLAANSG